MVNRFSGQVVLVTGGSRNTGLEIVDLFLREGARVFFCGTSEASVAAGEAELARRGRTGFRGIVCDVGKSADVTAMMDAIAAEAGRLDAVVSNAAHLGQGENPAPDVNEPSFLDVLNVNLGGTLRVVQEAARRFFLVQEPNPATGQRGVVVCIGSNTAHHVQRRHVSYCTSKGGLESLVQCLALDLGPRGVRVNLLEPGYIWTERWHDLPETVRRKRRANTLTGREATGRDVAAAAAFLLSDEARAFQGAILKMDAGATVALYPPYAEDSVPLPAEWKGAEAFSGAVSLDANDTNSN
ncbi:MAG: SDR family oxidoreductase [Kiritimatiellae bacterium]|nr:SDR family oxidoreductase [Kiritimatiellia bacterium]